MKIFNKKTNKETAKLPMTGKIKKGFRFYCAVVMALTLVFGMSMSAFAATNDPLTVVNAQENCDVQEPSDNVIIYGHHMKNGSMFCDLEKFKSEDFYKEHRMISFNTLTDKCEYEIVAVFKTFVYSDSPESFKYYRFVNAETSEQFDEYIAKCKELSLYDTGVSAEYGDKLITLSTCEYSRSNGRLVVVAKRV